MEENAAPTIRNLYPQLDEEELREAEQNLDRYLALVLRIFEPVESENHPQVGQLTDGTRTLRSTPPPSEASI
jgi:hypothetical protein